MLEIRSAPDLEALGDGCADVLATPLEDPFAAEWIAVPTGTVRSWLQRHLAGRLGASGSARRDGVAMNIRFVRGDGLRQELLGHPWDRRDATPDPWSTQAMTWVLMSLGADPARVSRDLGPPLATWASRHAARFAKYQIHRPDRLREWLRRPVPDGPVDADDARSLYRLLGATIACPDPAEQIARTLEELRSEPPSVTARLPTRLMFFGFTVAPDNATFPESIRLLSDHLEIHYFGLDPTPQGDKAGWPPLVRSWGRTLGDAHALLDTPSGSGQPSTSDEPTGSVFTRLRRLVTTGAASTGPADASVVIHGCQGLTRQVEVLRDDVLRRLSDDTDLTEEDIVVLCADLEGAAPVIRSVLGDPSGIAAAPGATPALRYHIDGLPASSSDPVAVAFTRLLEMVTGRVTSVDVVAFCQLDAVMTRWRFSDDDIATFRRWTSELGVRWGLDPEHRARFDIPEALTLGTWRRALDRLAMGIAYASNDVIVDRAAPGGDPDPASPFGIEGDDVERLGRLSDLIARVEEISGDATELVAVGDRLERLRRVIPELFEDPDGRGDAVERVKRLCRIPEDAAGIVDPSFPSTLADLVPVLTAGLGTASGSSADVTRGGITIATPRTLSGIPRRVSYLLDFDDDWIPSGVTEFGDLLAVDHRPGDPDARGEARLAVLTAITATTDALVVMRNERDIRTNAPIPDGILVSELLEALDSIVAGSDASVAGRPSTDLFVSHPRESTSPDNFTVSDSDAATRPISFDTVALGAAQARVGPRPALFDPGATPIARVTERSEVIQLDDIRLLLRNPATYVCSNVLDIRLPYELSGASERLPITMDALETHHLKADLVDCLLSEGETGELYSGLRAADRLPVAAFGDLAFEAAERTVEPVVALTEAALAGRTRRPVHIDLALGDGRRIMGIAEVWSDADTSAIIDVTVSKLKNRQRLVALATLVALAAHDGTRTWQSQLIDPDRKKPVTITIPVHNLGDPVDEFLRSALDRFIDLYDVAQLGPVPFIAEMFKLDGALTMPNSRRAAWLKDLMRRKPSRFLYGDQPFAAFMGAHVHQDDPGSHEHTATPTGRAEHLGDQLMGLLYDAGAVAKSMAGRP